MDITSRNKTDSPPRILEYRYQVKIASQFIKHLSYFCFLVFLATVVAYFFEDEKGRDSYLGIVISTGIAWLGIFLEYLFLLKSLGFD